MKILLFDIETSPNVGFSWGNKWNVNIIEFVRESYMISFSYMWLGDREVKSYALPDFPSYKKDRHNDKQLSKKLLELFEEADVVVAHNGDNFDIRFAKGRFFVHRLKIPRKVASIDTLKVLRRNFNFPSYKLNDVCKRLGFGGKVQHEGFPLWVKCLDGDPEAWARMVEYNKHDVVLLKKLYLYLLPWVNNHPNYNVFLGTHDRCPRCGGKIVKAGFERTKTNTFQTYRCYKCGARPRSKNPIDKPRVQVI